MFIKVKRPNGEFSKLETDSVVKYQKYSERTEVCLVGHFDIDFIEPTYEEFDKIMNPKRKRLDFTNYLYITVSIIMMATLVISYFSTR